MLKTFPENASQRKTVAGGRPKLSLASLIGQAILASDGVKARLSTIYEWIAKNYPEYYQLNHGGWQVLGSLYLFICLELNST